LSSAAEASRFLPAGLPFDLLEEILLCCAVAFGLYALLVRLGVLRSCLGYRKKKAKPAE